MQRTAVQPLMPVADALVGTWSGTEHLEPTPWVTGGPAEGRLSVGVAGGGHALVVDQVTRRAGEELFAVHAVLAPAGERLLWWWFDSAGHPPLAPATAVWEDGTLTVTKETGRGRATTLLTVHAGGGLEQQITMTPAGARDAADVMRGTYTRDRG